MEILPPFHSRLVIWNQARINVKILGKDELSKEKVREGAEEVSDPRGLVLRPNLRL
jgi:hypothetical protein